MARFKKRMARFKKRHHDSISPLDCGLCPQVDVRWVPVMEATAANKSLRNSGASSECRVSVRRASAKVEFIEEARYQSGGEAVDQGKSFGLTGLGKALTLKVHGIAEMGFVGGV